MIYRQPYVQEEEWSTVLINKTAVIYYKLSTKKKGSVIKKTWGKEILVELKKKTKVIKYDLLYL